MDVLPNVGTNEANQFRQNMSIQAIIRALGDGVWKNARSAQTANYTVVQSDQGTTLGLGGNAFFTLTFSAPSSYSTQFLVLVVNEDSFGSGRAKKIAFSSGGTSFFLWPGQTVLIFRVGSSWRSNPEYQRAKLPATGITINTDFTNGSDTDLANDGLATGSGNALKTVNYALLFAHKHFDWAGNASDPGIKILMASGTTDTTGVHFSPHSYVGAQGSNVIRIDGNGSTVYPASGTAMAFFFGLVLRIRNIHIKTDAGAGLAAISGAKVYIEDGVSFDKSSIAGAIYCENAQVKIMNDITFAGANAHTYLIQNDGGRIDTDGNAITATISANQNLTATVYGVWPGLLNLQQFTWNTGAFTITATNSYSLIGNHVLTGSAGVPGTGAPSVVAGSQAL